MKKEEAQDVVSALGVYKAHVACAFGAAAFSPVMAVVLGAALVDTSQTTAKFINGEIGADKAKEELHATIWGTVEAAVATIAKTGIDVLAHVATVYFPTFTGAIHTVAHIVKETLIPSVVEPMVAVVKSCWKWLTS